MTPRERTVSLIRTLRAYKLASPRRRMPRPLEPDMIRAAYFKTIVSRWLEPARRFVETELWPDIDAALRERRDGINDAMDRAAKRFYDIVLRPRDLEDATRAVADKTADFQKGQLDRQLRAAVGVDVFAAEPNLVPITNRFVTENVALIKSIPSTYFSDIERVIARGVQGGLRHEEIAAILSERYGIAENRAKLIARDQVGKFYGKLAEVRQRAVGVDGYIWQTMNDNRVRPEHEHLQGRRFSWGEAPPDGIPGEAVNCRCYAEPDLSAILGDAG